LTIRDPPLETQCLRKQSFDVIVLGAGAAGLMGAIEAGKRGRRVAVLERAERIGKKILISGGGRCNFTNLHCRPDNFLSNNPHFCKSALARYTPHDFIALVQKHGIAYHEKKLGQLFCDRAAQDIVGMLEAECRSVGVQIFTRVEVSEVDHPSHYLVRSADIDFESESLVVATGGLSIPKIGATAFGYEVAKQFGVAIVPCRPALVPLVLNAGDMKSYCDLSGVSTEVVASIGKQHFREKMLITHRGLSGPAILQISSYWDGRQPIAIDLAPDKKMTDSLRSSTKRDLAAAKLALHKALPIRLAERWLELHPPQRWTNADLDNMEQQLHHWEVLPSGTEGYEKAEVTAGGVDTDELSAKTMEAKKASGLFFIGEVVDVTGHLGGFNFQWAWASGYSAGQVV
jgi:predicted Rossmann fold flavoprotein